MQAGEYAFQTFDEKVRNAITTYKNDFVIVTQLEQNENVTIPAFLHAHKNYEFLIPKGAIPCLIQNNSIFFGEHGYVYPFQPQDNHGLQYELANAGYVDIIIDAEYFDNLKEKLGKKDYIIDKEFVFSIDLYEALGELINEGKLRDRNEAKFNELAEKLCKQIILTGSNPDFIPNPMKKQFFLGEIKSVIEELNNNYTKEIDFKALADKANLSRNYFVISFRDATGETPISYVNKLRASKAKQMMYDDPYIQLDTIYKLLGYNNPSSFTESFKRLAGMTPSEYRKSKREIFERKKVLKK